MTGAEQLTVAYLAFGPRRVVDITAFSALTFLHAARSLPVQSRVVIYTDRPEAFTRLGVDVSLITLSEIEAVTEPSYPFRIKIGVIQDAATRHPGNLMFVDGDTYFTKPPHDELAALSAGVPVMHAHDTLMADARPEVVDLKLLEDQAESSTLLPSIDSWPEWIWNSGVVGLSESHKHLIPEVLATSDEIRARTGSRISEQMAFTLVLSNHMQLVDAGSVFHYWSSKEQIFYEIIHFLRQNRGIEPSELAARAYALQPLPDPMWEPPLKIRVRAAARTARQSVTRLTSGG
jgi:hypothetical protein